MLRPSVILPRTENTHHLTACPTTHPPPLVLVLPLFEAWLRAGSTGSIPPNTALGVCCNTLTALCLPTHSPQLEPPYPLCWAGDDDVGQAQSRLPRAVRGAGVPDSRSPFPHLGGGDQLGGGGFVLDAPCGVVLFFLLQRSGLARRPIPQYSTHGRSDERPGIGDCNAAATHPTPA